MVTRSILGRIVVIGILVASLAVIGHATLLWSGRKPVKAQAAMSTEETTLNKGEATPVRVVYPGPGTASDDVRPKVTGQLPPTPFPDPKARTLDAQAEPPVQGTPPNAASPPPGPTAVPPPDPATPPARTPDPRGLGPKTAILDPALDDGLTGPSAGHDAAPSPRGKPPAGGLNINRASVEALNRLEGGRIGETIARHRPYASIEDLVRKRVLRRSVFDRIKAKIAAE